MIQQEYRHRCIVEDGVQPLRDLFERAQCGVTLCRILNRREENGSSLIEQELQGDRDIILCAVLAPVYGVEVLNSFFARPKRSE